MRRLLIAVGAGGGLSGVSYLLFFTWARPVTMVILWPGIRLVTWLQPSCFGIPHGDLKVVVASAVIYVALVWVILFFLTRLWTRKRSSQARS